jgi:hypothetical protein
MTRATQIRPGRTGTRLATRIAVTTSMVLASAGVAVTTAPPAHASVTEVAVAGGGLPSQSATASCSDGEWLSGAGGGIIDGGDDVTLTAVIPEADVAAGDYSVTVRAHVNPGGAPLFTVVAQAICMPGAPPPNYQIVSQPTGPNGVPSKAPRASCPVVAGTQTRVLGAGAELRDGFGQPLGSGEVLFRWIYPNVDLTYNDVFADAAGGFANNWEAVAYAICATPTGADPFWNSNASPTSSANTQTETTGVCPVDTPLMTGVGSATAPVTAPALGGFVFINEMRADLVQQHATARVVEGVNLAPNDTWYMVATGICWEL